VSDIVKLAAEVLDSVATYKDAYHANEADGFSVDVASYETCLNADLACMVTCKDAAPALAEWVHLVDEVTRSYLADPVAAKVVGLIWAEAFNGLRARLGLPEVP
jgi:hypothetical protein